MSMSLSRRMADMAEVAVDRTTCDTTSGRLVKSVSVSHRIAEMAEVAVARSDDGVGGSIIPADELVLASQCPVNVLVTATSHDDRLACARLIHDNSMRSSGPFVVARGRGASGRDIAGDDVELWFERASGGSLFIDDVSGLGREGQAQLFQHLERNALSRGTESDDANRKQVRVITGASRTLFAAIAAGRFSEALFYRLNLIHIDRLDRDGGMWLSGSELNETPDIPDSGGPQAAFS